jgi:hypothetical protein
MATVETPEIESGTETACRRGSSGLLVCEATRGSPLGPGPLASMSSLARRGRWRSASMLSMGVTPASGSFEKDQA